MEDPMMRAILFVMAAGSIMWSMTGICAYAAVPEIADANEARYSTGRASPPFANEPCVA